MQLGSRIYVTTKRREWHEGYNCWVLSNNLIKVEQPPWKFRKLTFPVLALHPDEGPTLKMQSRKKIVLLLIAKCSIPTISGYFLNRAADWKLDQPDWTGRVRVCAKGKECYIKIEDKNSGKLSCCISIISKILNYLTFFVILGFTSWNGLIQAQVAVCLQSCSKNIAKWFDVASQVSSLPSVLSMTTLV